MNTSSSLYFLFNTVVLGLDPGLPVIPWSHSSCPCYVAGEKSCHCQECIQSINTFDSLRETFYKLGFKREKIVPVVFYKSSASTMSVVHDHIFYSVLYMDTHLNLKSWFLPRLLLTYTFLCCCCGEQSWLFSVLACCSTKSRVSALKAKHTANLRQAYEGTWLEWRLFLVYLF